MLTTEWKRKLHGALGKGINDLPHALLSSSTSAPASRLPRLTSCLPSEQPASLTTVSLFIYFFVLILRAKGCRGFLPAPNYPPRPCPAVTAEAKRLQRTRRQESGQRPLSLSAVVATGWASRQGSSSFCSLINVRNRRVNEQFQLVTGVALLRGWP